MSSAGVVALKPDAFQACFTMWLTALRAAAAEATGVERPTLAIDGKTLRRSHDRGRNLGAVAFRQRVGERVWSDTRAGGHGGEIERNHGDSHAVVADDIQGAIITIDAMGTQTAIAEKIMDGWRLHSGVEGKPGNVARRDHRLYP